MYAPNSLNSLTKKYLQASVKAVKEFYCKLPEREALWFFVCLFVCFVLRQWAKNSRINRCMSSFNYFPFNFLVWQRSWFRTRGDRWFPFSTIYHCSFQTFPMLSRKLVCAVQPKGMTKSFGGKNNNLEMCRGIIIDTKWRRYPAIFRKRLVLCNISDILFMYLREKCESEKQHMFF